MTKAIDRLQHATTDAERKQIMRWTRRKARGRQLTEEEKEIEKKYRALKARPVRHEVRDMSW